MWKALLLECTTVGVFATFARPVPSAALKERLRAEEDVIGIVHWGLNTYTDREWGYGDENPKDLSPAKFDADQIVQACAAGGLKGLVVVAKHHDGFCLWPTKTTEHNITKSPFRGGKGDYVREMADACRKAGMKFGVYVSPWDRNSADYGTAKYVETYHAQIKELLGGNYGEVFEMWFDGANGGDGYYGGARENRKIPKGYYRFDEVFKFVRVFQPKVCIFGMGGEFMWPGNECGDVDPDKSPSDDKTFRMWEADFPLRPGWFYHAKERGKSKHAVYLMNRYLSSVGNGGTMNIGIAPNKDGLLDEEDVKALKGFGELRKAFFKDKVVGARPFNVVVTRNEFGVKRIRLTDDTSVHGERYWVDPKILRLVREATTDSGETDTAKWMTGVEKEKTAASCGEDCREVMAVRGEAPSFLPRDKDLKLVWHDEFNGTALDETKWCFRTNFWGRRASWFAAPEDGAVEVRGGLAHLKIIERDGQLRSPQLQTGGLLWDIPQERDGIWLFPARAKAKYLKRYGYFECRCRLQQLPGWWSAFWMQAEANGATTDPAASGIEHDIMESFSPGKVIPSFFHFNGYGAEYRNFASSRRPIDENEKLSDSVDKTLFHTFGMLWEPDGYTLYLDGKKRGYKVGTGPGEAVSHVPEFILVTTEVKGCREPGSVDSTYGSGVATPESYETARAGDDFVVEYVRVFDIVDSVKGD